MRQGVGIGPANDGRSEAKGSLMLEVNELGTCEVNGKWFISAICGLLFADEVAAMTVAELDRSDTFGPFESEEAAQAYMRGE